MIVYRWRMGLVTDFMQDRGSFSLVDLYCRRVDKKTSGRERGKRTVHRKVAAGCFQIWCSPSRARHGSTQIGSNLL
jgi:hypothetical protein